MPRKRYKPEEIVTKLHQVDVLVSQGSSVADAIRQIGVSEVTYYRCRPGHREIGQALPGCWISDDTPQQRRGDSGGRYAAGDRRPVSF